MLYHWGTLMKFGNSSSFKHKQLHYCLILIVRCRNPQVILSNSLSGAAIIDKVWQEGEEPQACRFPLFWKAAEQPEGQNGLEPIFCFWASLWGTCPKSGSQITLRLCSSSCCCTRGRENVSAVISESEQCPHRVGRSLISSGKVKELKLDEGRMKRNVTAEESSDTDRRALLKSGRQLWHHQTINNQRIDRSRPQSCPAFRVQMMLRQHSSGPLWGS